MSDRTRTAIITVVTTVWAVNFGAGFVVEEYKPDQAINGIFMAVVGGLFALGGRSSSVPNTTKDKPKDEVKPNE